MLVTLAAHRVEFVIIGGLAGAAHDVGWPTTDVDIVIDTAHENMAALHSALQELDAEYNTPHSPPIVPDLRRLRSLGGPQLFRTKHGRLDVLKEAGGETYETLTRDAVTAVYGTIEVRCASLEALVRMKLAANRPKDQAVVRRLQEALASKKNERE